MLGFNEFQQYVQEHLPEALPSELKDATIRVAEVIKNNNRTFHGISVTPNGSNIAPNIYLEDFYKKYQDGMGLDEILEAVSETVATHVNVPEEFTNIAQDFQNFDFVKDRVVMVAVNASRNKNLLEQVPHQIREDLALIYKVVIGNNADGMASITVRNEHLQVWGVSAEEIHGIAMENTKEIMPISVKSMNEIMREMFGSDGMPDDMAELMFEELPANQQMYVISNESRMNGAATMFYEDALSELAEKIGTDLYILPSSIHELIAVSTDMATPEALSAMVRDVNGSQVSEDEQLSDHVYKYDAKSKQITLADTTIEELNEAACMSQANEMVSEQAQVSAVHHNKR